MKKTVLEYTTDTYQEDIPKHILQENKIRLNSFFLEQESVQKKGILFVFRYAFYSVENPRKVTKQYLLKEYEKAIENKRANKGENKKVSKWMSIHISRHIYEWKTTIRILKVVYYP